MKAAAVADFRPAEIATHKWKKRQQMRNEQCLRLALEPTTDILAELGESQDSGVFVVGFAAETENLIENARNKLRDKNCNLVVANDVSVVGSGFASERNHVYLVTENKVVEIPEAHKNVVAHAILDHVAERL